MDSDWEYEEEPAVVFSPESHVHETEDVLESEENQTVTIAPPDVPLEQEETSAAGEEERHSENNDTDTEAGSPNREEELLINLSKRPHVGRASARLRGAPAARRGRGHAGRVRTQGGHVAAARVKSYNQHIGGVDRVNQQLHNLQTLRKSYKWYCKIALRLIMQTILNAHKIHAAETGSTMSFLEFVVEVIKSLSTGTPEEQENFRVPVAENHAIG